MCKKLKRIVAVMSIAALTFVSLMPTVDFVSAEENTEATQTAAEATATTEATEATEAIQSTDEKSGSPKLSAMAVSMPSLTDKSLYYLGDSVAGGLCLVSSNTFMLKRAAIIMGSTKYSTITLSAINAKGIKYKEYYYTNDGYTYHVNKYTKFTTQTVAGVQSQLIQLLKGRPEGVIIYGDKAQDNDAAAGKAADHGILITEYKNGIFYGIDPSHNRNGKSKGIEKLSDTSIVTLKGVTHYMCIQDITYKSSTQATTTTKATTTKAGATTTTKATTKTTTKAATTTKATTAAASTLKISSYTYPKTLNQGSPFTIKGTIQSNYKIASVTISIVNSKGKVKISKSAKPAATKYSLAKLDNAVKFGTLTAGTYTYKVTAKDAKKSLTLVSKKFKIDPPSTLKISSARYPKELVQGKAFTIKGKVASNYNLKSVTVGVYTTAGKAKQSATKSISKKKSYNILGLDNKIKFGTLEKGTYYFKVTAKDTKKTKVVLNKKFTVK